MELFNVLYNPLAGNSTGEKAARRLTEIYPAQSLTFTDITKITSYQDYFDSLKENESVILCGGDGTLNRFVNAVYGMNHGRNIYYFATGSGNDFLRDVGSDQNKPFLINKYLTSLPCVYVNGKKSLFINGIGYGIDGYCCEVGDKQRQTSEKPVNYTSIAIKGLLFHFRPTNATVTVDGVTKSYKKVWLAPTMNGRFYGGGMNTAPKQDRLNKEGSVSLVVLHGSGKLKTLCVFPSIFEGKHVEHSEMVDVLTGKNITVKFDRPTALQIDGETVLGVSEYRVEA